MPHDSVIVKTLAALEPFKPKSVFLYGSRSRADFTPDSDYEIGAIFDDDAYVQRRDIHAVISDPNVKVYPFKLSALVNGSLDWLFQKSLFMREIIQHGKTIGGEDIISQISPPPITTLDLVQDIRFSIARSLDALLSFRAGDTKTSMELFSKSCFYGLRCLEILELKTFPSGYDEIRKLSTEVVRDPSYRKVIEVAHALRKGGPNPNIDILYDNIGLLDGFIEPKILAAFKARGNVEIL